MTTRADRGKPPCLAAYQTLLAEPMMSVCVPNSLNFRPPLAVSTETL